MSRPSKYQNLMDQARVVALRSHDAETKVGSLLVKLYSGAVVATGTNGFVRNAPDLQLPNTRPDKYALIQHSERNLMDNCLRHGISTEDTFLVCTLTPCTACTRSLYQAGITKVIAAEKYRDFDSIMNMPDLYVAESLTVEGFIELNYGAKIGNLGGIEPINIKS